MKKIKPEFTRRRVNEAGEILLRPRRSIEDWHAYVAAFDVLNNWRASHNYPLNTFQANIRTKIRRGGYRDSIVAQRLKRVPSIIEKLRRETHMKLSTMQDIGGIRAIMPTLRDAQTIADSFRWSKLSHEVVKEYDYIAKPKDSGYRSIHFVYRYRNKRAPEYDGLRIELQIRDQLQHSWATAVEVVGAFLNTSLKASEGPGRWLEFFAMVGSGFALLEDCRPSERFMHLDTRALVGQIARLEEELSVTRTLEAYGATVRAIDFKQHNFRYYLLHMVPKEMTVSYSGFHEDQLEQATQSYLDLEKNIQEDTYEQVVLVSGVTFQELQRAYPNYFLDSKLFLENLEKLKKEMG